MRFRDQLRGVGTVLMEGAVIERLRREPRVMLDEHILHAGFLYEPDNRALLGGILREYMQIGSDARLAMAALTPTWRASGERLRLAGLGGRRVNADAVAFVRELRTGFGPYAESIAIGGCIGCRGDAYNAGEALGAAEAEQYHLEQVQGLSRAGADFLMAATLPAVSEALGIARTMATTGTPYLLSFIIREDGCLLDKTPLSEAIRSIDGGVRPRPDGYMVNCVHHSVFGRASASWDAAERKRLVGLQANTSPKPPEVLDGASQLESEEPDAFAEAMVELHRRFPLKLLGGCCGTGAPHIRALASRLCRPPMATPASPL
ncbi:MAG: homocysteine S-methyltransferase family protein [bacterium]|nr:homocysteine S-methyltransferase family protein [bacterium]